jgi:hypothetical protein
MTATRPPDMIGFEIDTVEAYWIVCQRCADSELVYGSTADMDALTWAGDHQRECSR